MDSIDTRSLALTPHEPPNPSLSEDRPQTIKCVCRMPSPPPKKHIRDYCYGKWRE